MSRAIVSRRIVLAGLGAGALALAAPPGSGLAASRDGPAHGADPAVINEWNAILVDTVVAAGKANAEGFIWFGFVQAAVYNAVVGITRRFELYKWDEHGPKGASPQAAAAAAANRVLLNYFGNVAGVQTRLATAYAASLGGIRPGPAKEQGILYGERAANHFIALRQNDGRNADLLFTTPVAPGVWRPTPTGFAPFFAPWLSQMKPLMIRSARQFRSPGPLSMTSAAYAAEFNEVKALGGNGTTTLTQRTDAQTLTAHYLISITQGPLQAALRDLATRRGMDISERARLFAAVDMSVADAVCVSWDSKFHYGFWRPITAIQLADQDGNPDTAPDPAWTPLLVSPPYPDHTSGLCSVIGAATRALTRVLRTNRIDLTIASSVASRYYEFAAPLRADGVDARVWSGIHFRTAEEAGLAAGTKVADWSLDHYFQRSRSSDDRESDDRDDRGSDDRD
jgi:hypothetical protein